MSPWIQEGIKAIYTLVGVKPLTLGSLQGAESIRDGIGRMRSSQPEACVLGGADDKSTDTEEEPKAGGV